MRTQVGIVGAGPAGLLLSHLLALHGIDSVVVDDRSREHIVARARAGVLEHGSADLLRRAGLGARMDREGIVHGGIYLQYDGVREHLDFRDLTGGRTVMVYAQTEVVRDLVAARLAAGADLVFEVRDTEVDELTSDHPVLRYTTPDGVRHDVVCDVIAGCDGFHGVSRPSIPHRALTIFDRTYPYAWLGILARVPPSTDELIYAYHRDGFALHSLRGPEVSRLYLQVPPDEQLSAWPDERIWTELRRRFALPGWELADGPIFDRSVTPMRSFVASPMRYGRLFLAGDAAHIVPPTGAKGLNLAIADVAVLAEALVALLRDGRPDLADAYSDRCLRRVWRATHFSWWMTSMLHRAPDGDEMQEQLQLAQLRYTTSSRAAATTLAENYVGYPPLDLGGLDLPGATRTGPAGRAAGRAARR